MNYILYPAKRSGVGFGKRISYHLEVKKKKCKKRVSGKKFPGKELKKLSTQLSPAYLMIRLLS